MAVVAAVLYAHSVGHGYVLDDALTISHNTMVKRGLAGLGDILTRDSMYGFFGEKTDLVAGGRYRPLQLATFAVEQELFGMNPAPAHAVNVLLHALTGVLVLFLLREMLGEGGREPPFPVPLVASLLFVAHPIHTEVVANIEGRDEILSLLGSLAALWACLRGTRGRSDRWGAAGGAVYFLALLSKENAITFLAVIPLTLWFFTDASRRQIARSSAPLLAAAAIYLALRQLVVASPEASSELMNNAYLGASPSEHWATVVYCLGLYLKLLVFPHPLTHDYYPYHVQLLDWSDARVWLSMLAHLALAGIALAGLRRRWTISWAIAVHALTISIVANVFFPIGTFIAERFLYASSLAFAVGVAVGLHALARRWEARTTRLALGAALGVVLLLYAAKTVTRVEVWRDNYTLATTDVRVSSGSASANLNAARQLMDRADEETQPARRREQIRLARRYLDRALEIHPRYKHALAAKSRLHEVFLEDFDGSIAIRERLYALNPRWSRLAFGLGTDLLIHQPERIDDAVAYLEAAVALAPGDASALGNLAAAVYQQGDPERAVELFELAASLQPDNAELHRNLAEILRELGEEERAQAREERARTLPGGSKDRVRLPERDPGRDGSRPTRSEPRESEGREPR